MHANRFCLRLVSGPQPVLLDFKLDMTVKQLRHERL
jgi:hypothetical protein